MKKVVRRVIAVIPAIVLQALWFTLLIRWLAPYAAVLSAALTFCAFLYVLYIISSHEESTYKTLWLLVILGFPIAGAVLYLLVGNKRTARPIRERLTRAKAAMKDELLSESVPLEQLEGVSTRTAQTVGYLHRMTGYPVLPCADTTYYPLGEFLWKDMVAALETAEKFIFAEYFIVEDGLMWDTMVEIMARKAAQGVDVRFLYDDFGSISTYSFENVRKLREKGIQCVVFNPVTKIKGTVNYRDHRKMLIVDGKTAFSGGINLADEYINRVEKFGHWKDIGFRITGAPVQNYTRMFTEFWNAFSKSKIPVHEPALPAVAETGGANGYVLSYYDSPVDAEDISNTLYVELLSQAERYAWFYTPYLMLGDTLMDAFVRAARRGVDVRIIMPGVPDKKVVYRMSRSYYAALLEAGVRIFEYTPGFVHAKGCVIDDVVGTIGTVNLDYRSLFLHFENNSLFCGAPLLADFKADFLATQEQCAERTKDNVKKGFFKWVLDGILRIFAPLC